MTEPEFRQLVTELAAEELDKQTAEGLLPADTDQRYVQYFFELNAEVIYQSVMMNPSLRAKLPFTPREEVAGLIRRLLKESDRMTRDKMNMPYRKE
jgi:hypothetical protein